MRPSRLVVRPPKPAPAGPGPRREAALGRVEARFRARPGLPCRPDRKANVVVQKRSDPVLEVAHPSRALREGEDRAPGGPGGGAGGTTHLPCPAPWARVFRPGEQGRRGPEGERGPCAPGPPGPLAGK